MINSRRKGAKNERDIAKILETWTGKKFAKTPASGGLQWKTAMSKGDVVCTTEGHFFPFCIEGKFYNKIDFSHLLTPGIKNIDILDFWKQCDRDAKLCSKVPMLLMRYNGLPKGFYYMVLPFEFYQKIGMFTRALHIRKTLTFWDKDADLRLVMIPSPQFFELPYKEIKLIAKKHGKTS